MKKSDILFFLFVIALFLPFFISDTIYEWYKSFNAIHGMVMSFVKFAILATLGEMLAISFASAQSVSQQDLRYYPTHGNLGGTGSITSYRC